MSAFVRSDIQVIGPTWFYPDNFTERDRVGLLNVRLGMDGKSWSATVWAKNLTDKHTTRSGRPDRCSFRIRATPTISFSRECRDAGASI